MFGSVFWFSHLKTADFRFWWRAVRFAESFSILVFCFRFLSTDDGRQDFRFCRFGQCFARFFVIALKNCGFSVLVASSLQVFSILVFWLRSLSSDDDGHQQLTTHNGPVNKERVLIDSFKYTPYTWTPQESQLFTTNKTLRGLYAWNETLRVFATLRHVFMRIHKQSDLIGPFKILMIFNF